MASLVAALHARAASWRISMPPNNLKQADVLKGAVISAKSQRLRSCQWLDTALKVIAS